MPTKSSYPDITVPEVDLWAFMFERKDKPFSDDQGTMLQYTYNFRLDLIRM